MISNKLNLIERSSSTIGVGDYITYKGVNYHLLVASGTAVKFKE
jgi:hypothetical protein